MTRVCETYDELLGDASGALNGRVLEGEHGVILLCFPVISDTLFLRTIMVGGGFVRRGHRGRGGSHRKSCSRTE